MLTSPFRAITRLGRPFRPRNELVEPIRPKQDNVLGEVGLTRADLHAMLAEPWWRGPGSVTRAIIRRSITVDGARGEAHHLDVDNFR